MKLEFPKKSDSRMNAESLCRALNFSKQHWNVISKALKKAFPEDWPEDLGEEEFCTRFHKLLMDPNARVELQSALQDLAKQKKDSWQRVLNLELRLIFRARDVVDSPDDWRGEDGLEALMQLAADAGYPEIGWWFDWLVTGDDMSDEDCLNSSSGVSDLSTEVLHRNWRQILDQMESGLQAAADEPPSIEYVARLEGQVSRLRKIATDYEAARAPTELIQECSGILENIVVADNRDLQESIAKGREAVAAFEGTRDELQEWRDRLKKVAESLNDAAANEERQNTDLQEAVSRKDYDQVSRASELANSTLSH